MSTAQLGHRMQEPEEPHGHTEALPHHEIPYYWIFGWLVALTILTVAVAYKRADNELVNVLIALLIATTKATFVARYFMHLKFEGKVVRVIFIAPLILCVLLIIALIPDVGHGRAHLINDMIAWCERLFPGTHSSGQEPG